MSTYSGHSDGANGGGEVVTVLGSSAEGVRPHATDDVPSSNKVVWLWSLAITTR